MSPESVLHHATDLTCEPLTLLTVDLFADQV